MKRIFKKVLIIITVIVMVVSLGACGGTVTTVSSPTAATMAPTTAATTAPTTAATTAATAETTAAATEAAAPTDLPVLNLTVYIAGSVPTSLAGVKNDVVTPYLEKKFNIKVKEITGWSTQSVDEQIAMWASAKNQPDVFFEATGNMVKFVNGGIVQPLDDYVPTGMTEHDKYFDSQYWKWWQSPDGHYYSIPSVIVNMDLPKYADDPYNTLTNKWAMWVREDIALQAGYKLTKLDDIQKATTDVGKKPTTADFAFDPPIKTPADYLEFLRKVKALNLKVGGQPVYAVNMTPWQTWHFGAMFDWGYWEKNADGSVSGLFGNPGAKDYYKFLRTIVNEGLMDPNFAVQKEEQLHDKIATGRVAAGMFVDPPQITALQKAIPGSNIRYIEWPKQTVGKGFYDVFTPGFNSVCISTNIAKGDVKRIVDYFNYMYSDEGLDILSWGPEEAGLWELKDGKKQFKDPAVANDCLKNIQGGVGADYYGLYDINGSSWAKGAAFTPYLATAAANKQLYVRSYPSQIAFRDYGRNLLGIGAADYTFNVASNGDNGPNVSASFGYFWGDFNSQDMITLITTKTDAEFNNVWTNTVLANFESKGKYSQAIKDMEVWYNTKWIH